MKRFLFVFLVLGWTIAASAQPSTNVSVLVFDMKASNAGFGYAVDTNTWRQIKDTNTAFVIVEPVTDYTANVWAVYTWKGKDKKNYAMDVNMGQATMGGDNTGFLVDGYPGYQIEVAGKNKVVTIGKKTSGSCLSCHTGGASDNLEAECPPSMAGYEMTNIVDVNGKKLCTSTVSLKLDIAKTLAAHINEVYTAEDGAAALISDLNDRSGYTIVEP